MGRKLVFQYPTSSDNKTTKFRLYVKNPGESSFALAAEFSGIDSTSCSRTDSSSRGQWLLDNNSGTCGYWSISWVNSGTTNAYVMGVSSMQLSSYAVGETSFYVAAADANGNEGTPSSIARLAYLNPLTITTPSGNQIFTTLVPTFQWTVNSDTPSTLPHFVAVFDSPSAANPIWSPYFSGGTSKTYSGPALDPAKQYILSVFGIDVDTGQNKSTLIMPSAIVNFSVSTATTTTATSTSFISKDIENQLANISATISRLSEEIKKMVIKKIAP